MVAEASDFAWSSHREILGIAENAFVERDVVLRKFGSLELYRERMMTPARAADIAISSQIVSDTNFDEAYFAELLGSDPFQVMSEMAETIAAETGLSFFDIVGPARARRESLARTRFIERAKGMGLPGLLIARFLGRSPSAVSRRKSI